MITVVEDRQQVKIFLTGDAKKVVKDFAHQFDMTEIGVASRVYNWFGSLPLPIQKWITGLTDGDEGEGMKQFARMLASGKAKYDVMEGTPIPQQETARASRSTQRK